MKRSNCGCGELQDLLNEWPDFESLQQDDPIAIMELNRVTGFLPKGVGHQSYAIFFDSYLICDDEAFLRLGRLLSNRIFRRELHEEISKRRFERSLAVLLANLIAAMRRDWDPWIAISRNKIDYQRRYTSPLINFNALRAAMDALRDLGYIEFRRGFRPPPGNTGFRTRMKPSDRFVRLVRNLGAADVRIFSVIEERETVVVKDAHGRFLDYDDSPRTFGMRAAIEAYNRQLSQARIVLPPDIPSAAIDFSQNRVYRVFSNRNLEEGGGFYGPWWASCSPEFRPFIEINDQPVIELTFEAQVVQQVYARQGFTCFEAMGDEDPYLIPGFESFPRAFGKVAFQILLNCFSEAHALVALMRSDVNTLLGDTQIGYQPNDVLTAVTVKHEEVEEQFLSGVGPKLQYEAACIAENVIRNGLDRGISVLLAQDGFIVAREHEYWLRAAMSTAWSETYPDCSGIPNIRAHPGRSSHDMGLAARSA